MDLKKNNIRKNFILYKQPILYKYKKEWNSLYFSLINKSLFEKDFIKGFINSIQKGGKKYLILNIILKSLAVNKNFFFLNIEVILKYLLSLFTIPFKSFKIKKKNKKDFFLCSMLEYKKLNKEYFLNLYHEFLLNDKKMKNKILQNFILEFYMILSKEFNKTTSLKLIKNKIRTYISNKS